MLKRHSGTCEIKNAVNVLDFDINQASLHLSKRLEIGSFTASGFSAFVCILHLYISFRRIVAFPSSGSKRVWYFPLKRQSHRKEGKAEKKRKHRKRSTPSHDIMHACAHSEWLPRRRLGYQMDSRARSRYPISRPHLASAFQPLLV